MFKNMEEVREANERVGNSFFSEGSMRYFNSRIESELFFGKYFVTSESPSEGSQKSFTVRRVHKCGRIDNVGRFQKFECVEDAVKKIRVLHSREN